MNEEGQANSGLSTLAEAVQSRVLPKPASPVPTPGIDVVPTPLESPAGPVLDPQPPLIVEKNGPISNIVPDCDQVLVDPEKITSNKIMPPDLMESTPGVDVVPTPLESPAGLVLNPQPPLVGEKNGPISNIVPDRDQVLVDPEKITSNKSMQPDLMESMTKIPSADMLHSQIADWVPIVLGLDVISGFQLFRRAAGIGIGIPSMAGTPGGLRVRRYSVRNVLLV